MVPDSLNFTDMGPGAAASNEYVDVNFNYTIQSRRIAKGYTQKELSFLLGWSKNDVEAIESFHANKDYAISDISRLIEILGCTLKDLFASGSMLYNRFQLSAKRHRDNYGIIYYEVYYLPEKENRLLYKLVEESHRASRLSQIRSAMITCVDGLIQQDYFKEVMEPMEIFAACRSALKDEFKPKHLQSVLSLYTRGGRNALLKKVEEDGRYGYSLSHMPSKIEKRINK